MKLSDAYARSKVKEPRFACCLRCGDAWVDDIATMGSIQCPNVGCICALNRGVKDPARHNCKFVQEPVDDECIGSAGSIDRHPIREGLVKKGGQNSFPTTPPPPSPKPQGTPHTCKDPVDDECIGSADPIPDAGFNPPEFADPSKSALRSFLEATQLLLRKAKAAKVHIRISGGKRNQYKIEVESVK